MKSIIGLHKCLKIPPLCLRNSEENDGELEFLNNLWRTRVRIWLSYRPVGLHKPAELIRFDSVRKIGLSYRPARLHRLAIGISSWAQTFTNSVSALLSLNISPLCVMGSACLSQHTEERGEETKYDSKKLGWSGYSNIFDDPQLCGITYFSL